MTTALETCLQGVSPDVRAILEQSLGGREVSVDDGIALNEARGTDLHELCLVADEMRRQQVGDRVTYVVNRNINFTNVCIKNCKFCAFARTVRSEQGYFLPHEEIARRVRQAWEMGATEVCLQAGLSPNLTGDSYIELCRVVKEAAPDIHIHAFSPEEVKFGASLKRVSYSEYLAQLKDAGLGTLPGTSAEILDDRLRKTISPTRITTDEWLDVITAAHRLGIQTTSTMMFGHVESVEDRMRHLDLLRRVQRETGGFTEFVPLSFVHEEAPLFATSDVPGVRPGPTGDDVLRLYATARLMLGRDIANLQASWVKEGLRTSGGTLMNESISTAAGARHGQLMTPATLRRAIRDAGRVPVERDTAYGVIREFGDTSDQDPAEPLDTIQDPDQLFGSYDALTRDARFHYEPRGLRVVS